MRGSSLLAAGAVVLTGCFQGDFLRNTCEQQGGCPGPTSTGSTSGATTTSPPTTGDGTSTSTSTGSSAGDSDDTMVSGTTGMPPGIPIDAAAFRIKTIEIIDPHMYYKALACLDVTDYVNGALQKSIDDGDSNVLLVAKNYDPAQPFQEFQLFRDSSCPVGEDYCVLINTVLGVGFNSSNLDDGNCLDVMISTLNPANIDQLNIPVAPCVRSPSASVQLELTPDLSPITFYAGKFAGQYSPGDSDPTGLVNAIFYGFVPESDAQLIVFKFMNASINFWSVIRGSSHPDACPIPADGLPGSVPDVDMLDLDGDGPNLPVSGIYLYLNFTAERVKLYAPF